MEGPREYSKGAMTVLPVQKEHVNRGNPFRPEGSGLPGASRTLSQGGAVDIMDTPEHSDPHSLSPTMPSGTLYSSVIDVLQRDNEGQPQMGKQRVSQRKGPPMFLASDPASHDGTKTSKAYAKITRLGSLTPQQVTPFLEAKFPRPGHERPVLRQSGPWTSAVPNSGENEHLDTFIAI